MSVGQSGRIVIEVEPGVKRLLYSALAKEGLTLKDWFLRSAESYLRDDAQIPLPLNSSDAKAVNIAPKSKDFR